MKIPEKIQEIIIDYYSGKLTNDQADELLNWIFQSNNNLLYFRQLGEIWKASGVLSNKEYDTKKALGVINSKLKERGLRQLPGKVLHVRISTLKRIAATVLLVISLGVVSFLTLKKPETIPVYSALIETSVPKGSSKSTITLPDSTVIWLNADTRLRYALDYGTTNRNVYLEGEGYFKVAPNSNLPFIVFTSELTVTALGTAFNVKAYDNEEIVETTLEEGEVRIDPLKNYGRLKNMDPIILTKNQNAVYHKQAGKIAVGNKNMQIQKPRSGPAEKIIPSPVNVITVTDTKLYTSWKDSRWVFKNEKLSTLAPKLERRYDINILFADTSLFDYAFTGTLMDESLEQVLKAVGFIAPIRYIIDSKQVIFYKNKEIEKYFHNN